MFLAANTVWPRDWKGTLAAARPGLNRSPSPHTCLRPNRRLLPVRHSSLV